MVISNSSSLACIYTRKLSFIYHDLHIGQAMLVLRTALKSLSRLNEHQVSVLIKSFGDYCYPSKTKLKELMQQTGLSKIQIFNWFKYKRRTVKEGK